MKPIKTMCVAVLACGLISGADAATSCETRTRNNDCETYGTLGSSSGCSNYQDLCYYAPGPNAWRHMISCTNCNSGYTLKTYTTDGGYGCDGKISYGKCEGGGSTGGVITSCTWQTCSYGNTNIEECFTNGESRQKWRCKAGYYSDSTVTHCTFSCYPCPNGGTSDPDDNIGIEKCYQDAGTHSDSTGTYELSEKCYYTE